MKKAHSTQSLLNLRRGSLQKVQIQIKQGKERQRVIPKHRIPSPIAKNLKVQLHKQQQSKAQLKKTDIKQIYEYKIKQRAKKSIQLQRSSQMFNSIPYQKVEDQKLVESLKMQNQKMSKQLYDLGKENKRLKQLLITSKDKTSGKNDKIGVQKNDRLMNGKDYKKEMLNKLNDRQRLKTEMTTSFTKIHKQTTNNPQVKREGSSKNSTSKTKLNSTTRNSITMNLNMSFVKLKSPSTSTAKHQQLRQSSKQIIGKIMKSTSGNNLISKDQSIKLKEQQSRLQQQNAIPSLFTQYLGKKTIKYSDIQSFFELNKKIFAQFAHIIMQSKNVYTDMLNKINIADCYDSRRMKSSSCYKNQDRQVKNILEKIQELYRVHSVFNNSGNVNHGFQSSQNSGMKCNVSQIEPNFEENQRTPESSVVSFTERHPQRQKSHEKYRLKKLNENLQLIDNLQSKKLRTDVTEPQTTEPKVYLSKPISTNVSRKISFNNSFNNSLKNSKID